MENDSHKERPMGPGYAVLCYEIDVALREKTHNGTRFFGLGPREFLRVTPYEYDGPDKDHYKAFGFDFDVINLDGKTKTQDVDRIVKSFRIQRVWDKETGWVWEADELIQNQLTYTNRVYDRWNEISEAEATTKDNQLANLLEKVKACKPLEI